MRVPRTLERGSLEFNMTPMIDVTFLLIIFFLVSSHLAQQETQIELKLPTADSGQDAAASEARRVTVNVLADGGLLLGSRPVSHEELAEAIRFEHAQHPRELEVRIRCDRLVTYRQVEPIMVACARIGVWRVTFAVVRP